MGLFSSGTNSDSTAPKYRLLNFLGFLLCVGSLVFAVVYLQGELGLEPCPLCMASRLAIIGIAAFFFLAFLHNPGQFGQRFYTFFGILFSFAGIGITLRHIWLQSLPADKVPECGPGLEYMIEVFPLKDALGMILSGSGECAEIQWEILGFSLPQQTLAFLLLLLIIQLYQFSKKRQKTFFS